MNLICFDEFVNDFRFEDGKMIIRTAARISIIFVAIFPV
jgi:hypothetical protein